MAADNTARDLKQGRFRDIKGLDIDLFNGQINYLARHYHVITMDELINSTYGWQVRNDLNEGIERGVRDVPAFFVNGQLVSGKPTFENLSRDIESALKKSKKKVPAKQRA